MLPLTRYSKTHISNRLAIFAALLLVVTSLAGVGGSSLPTENGTRMAVDTVSEASVQTQISSATQVKKNKGFKVTLFLFRNN